MKPLIWIIDEEWPDYEVERKLLGEAFPGCEIRFSKNDFRADLEEFGKGADGILAQIYVDLDEGAIGKLERCRAISVFGGGYDRVDTEAAARKGITVTFVPGYCVEDVSDHAIACIYDCNKRVRSYRDPLREGLWGAPAVKHPVRRVRGSKLLVLGLGRIGRATAAKARALGMEVEAYDPYVDDETMRSLGVTKTNLESGLAAADFVSIHAKLTDETEGLIGPAELARMKSGAYLINTARGRIVREEALIEAVRNGVIAGAALDVIAQEPPSFSEPVLDCPGILVTPHISYLSRESFLELKTRATTNLIKVLKGEPVADRADH
jgi:D-3-phosphoglycerate dehydrogenase